MPWLTTDGAAVPVGDGGRVEPVEHGLDQVVVGRGRFGRDVEDLLDRPGHVPGVAQVAFACRAADVSAGAALLRAWLPATATATAGAAVRAILAVAVSAGDRAVTLATRAADLAVGAVARDDADRITAQPSPSLVAPRDGQRPSVVNGARILREVGFDRGAPGKWPFPNRTATP